MSHNKDLPDALYYVLVVYKDGSSALHNNAEKMSFPDALKVRDDILSKKTDDIREVRIWEIMELEEAKQDEAWWEENIAYEDEMLGSLIQRILEGKNARTGDRSHYLDNGDGWQYTQSVVVDEDGTRSDQQATGMEIAVKCASIFTDVVGSVVSFEQDRMHPKYGTIIVSSIDKVVGADF